MRRRRRFVTVRRPEQGEAAAGAARRKPARPRRDSAPPASLPQHGQPSVSRARLLLGALGAPLMLTSFDIPGRRPPSHTASAAATPPAPPYPKPPVPPRPPSPSAAAFWRRSRAQRSRACAGRRAAAQTTLAARGAGQSDNTHMGQSEPSSCCPCPSLTHLVIRTRALSAGPDRRGLLGLKQLICAGRGQLAIMGAHLAAITRRCNHPLHDLVASRGRLELAERDATQVA